MDEREPVKKYKPNAALSMNIRSRDIMMFSRPLSHHTASVPGNLTATAFIPTGAPSASATG